MRFGLMLMALSAGAAPAIAQTADQDVRCMIVANIFANAEKDASKRQVAGAARLFYLGRVDARMSGAGLKAALIAQAKTVTPENAGPAMTACARSMQGKMAALQAIGQSTPAKK